MYLCSGILVALLFIIVVFVGEQGPVGGQEVGSEFEPLNATVQKAIFVTGVQPGVRENILRETLPYERKWVIMEQPRCCSDCTHVAAGFKCKVKSCLHNCPWARSAASPRTLPMF